MTQQQLTPGFYWVKQKFANGRLSIIEIAEGASGVVFVNLLGTTHSPAWGEMVKSFEVGERIEEPLPADGWVAG